MKNKRIIIQEYEPKKIYKKYKSFIYRNTEFIYNGDNAEIKEIVKILNIKSKMKRLEYIFDESCKEIDQKFAGKNICDFKCNQCIVQRKNNSKEVNGCCRVCRFQGENGCKSSNLPCKLFFCPEIQKKYEIIKLKDLRLTKLLTKRQRLILKFDLFSSREEILMDLYIGIATIAAFRELYSLIKNSLFLIFKNKYNKKYNSKIKYLVIILTLALLAMFAVYHPIMPIIIIGVGMLEDFFIKIIKIKNRGIYNEKFKEY